MEIFLSLLIIIGIAAAVGFTLGYWVQDKDKQRLHTGIDASYKALMAQNESMKNSPTAVAHSQGFAEGYEQGVADSHHAIEDLIHNADPL